MALTRLAMANQSSHQNLCLFDVYRDQIRRITAKIDNIIMTIPNIATPSPRDGYGDAAMTDLVKRRTLAAKKRPQRATNP